MAVVVFDVGKRRAATFQNETNMKPKRAKETPQITFLFLRMWFFMRKGTPQSSKGKFPEFSCWNIRPTCKTRHPASYQKNGCRKWWTIMWKRYQKGATNHSFSTCLRKGDFRQLSVSLMQNVASCGLRVLNSGRIRKTNNPKTGSKNGYNKHKKKTKNGVGINSKFARNAEERGPEHEAKKRKRTM